ILLSSQHLHEVESIADNIIFIKNGEALYNGKMQEFGSDREENLFELTTAATKGEIIEALSHLDQISVEDRGRTKIIRTPVEMASNQLLGELVKQDIAVDYFRDISTSTLKLFREND
ncbi:MAG: ABC transporter ATP-binding protein, partial [Bacteroidota bacterium]